MSHGFKEASDTTVRARERRQHGQASGRWPPPSAGCRDLPCKTRQGPVAATGQGASKREAAEAGRWNREGLGRPRRWSHQLHNRYDSPEDLGSKAA